MNSAVPAATRASAHKLGRPVGTWSTIRHHFGRIQLIRKQSSVGGEHFARLEINRAAAIKKRLLITSNPQLDELFANLP